MPTPWIESVRRTGQLSVYFNPAISGSVWAEVASRAVHEFNQLSRLHQLGVQLVVVGRNVANIIVNISDGSASFSIDNQSHAVSLSSNALQGQTFNLSRSGSLFQSYVFLPSQPQVNTPHGQRPVGDGVKLVITVHEFIHCCGLSNSEHSSDDIFFGFPSVDYGRTSSGDVVVIQAAGQLRHTAPPLFLGATTISRVRGLWGIRSASGAGSEQHAAAPRNGIMGSEASRSGEILGGKFRPGPTGIA